MTKGKWLWCAVIGCLMVFLIFFALREPHYEGKPLAQWLAMLRNDDGEVRREAESAFRRFDDRVNTALAKQLTSTDSTVRRFFASRHIRVGVAGKTTELLPSRELQRAMAAQALRIRGPAAKSAIPELKQASETASPLIAGYAKAALLQIETATRSNPIADLKSAPTPVAAIQQASILYALGTNSDTLASQLIPSFDRVDETARYETVEFLCRNQMEPAVAIPILVHALQNGSQGIKANSLNAIIIQLSSSVATAQWKTAVHPAIIGCLTNNDVNIRGNAIAALSTCYPADALNIPPATLALLQNDRNPGISAWAASIQSKKK